MSIACIWTKYHWSLFKYSSSIILLQVSIHFASGTVANLKFLHQLVLNYERSSWSDFALANYERSCMTPCHRPPVTTQLLEESWGVQNVFTVQRREKNSHGSGETFIKITLPPRLTTQLEWISSDVKQCVMCWAKNRVADKKMWWGGGHNRVFQKYNESSGAPSGLDAGPSYFFGGKLFSNE